MNHYYGIIDNKNSMKHHGILGMKWGVRRYQNEDGTLTSAGKKRYRTDINGHFTDEKGTKKYYKDHAVEYFNKLGDYRKEFEKTEEGKTKFNNYQKAIKEMESSYDLYTGEADKKVEQNFNKVEKDYLTSQQKHAAKRLVEDYGDEIASVFANRGRISTGKDAFKALEDEWFLYAVYY